MNTLRARLLLTHLLPLLIIVPLTGIALIYLIETRVILPNLSRTLLGDAALFAEVTRDDPLLWNDPLYAQTILARVSPRLPARVMLFAGDGSLLGSSDPSDLQNLSRVLQGNPALDEALRGNSVQRFYYNQQIQDEALDVWEPVLGRQAEVIGVVRVTYPFSIVSADFTQSRTLIGLTLLAGLIFGGALGLALALAIGEPLHQATEAAFGLARGERSAPLVERGPLELRRLSAAFNSLAERLRGLENARRRLLANLVHELGRPLGALRSAVQALQKGAVKDPELTTELLNGMDGELVRLQGLLGELTQLYDQVLGTLELDRKPVEPGSWLVELLAPWQAAARDKGLQLEINITPPLPICSIDPLRLSQAVGNLLSNAVKFTPPGGVIKVSASIEGSNLQIGIADNGPGISPEDLENIFTPFFRGNQGRRFAEGMGLGLSIARESVRAHGGDLTVESQPGEGSRFIIAIPG
jgi:two-component system, OmpR family, sensor histidine kinase BaeS